MPVYIFDNNAFEKIVEVEGEEYRRFRTKEEFNFCSFEAFLEKWKEIYEPNEKFRDFRPEFGIDVGGNCAIYGLGGYNRYIVFNSGEIAFLRPSADGIDEILEKVRKARFRMSYQVGKQKVL